MGIKGKSVRSFLPIFLKYYSPTSSFSKTSTTTIYNILESYVRLSSTNSKKKICVSDIVKKSGYSRTTFYSYFYDTREITDMLEEMVSFHMYTNSNVYFNCFMGKLSPAEEEEVLMTIVDFNPFISALMKTFPDYKERYKDTFYRAFEMSLISNNVPEKMRPILSKALYATMVFLISEILKNDPDVSVKAAMDCAKLIVQSIAK